MSDLSTGDSDPLPPTVSSGGRAIFLGQAWKVVVRLATAATLARLLTPHSYGLYGMALIVYTVLYMAKDFGIGTALQQPDFSRQRFNALCQMGAAGGLLLATLGALLGRPVATFYHEPELQILLTVISLGLIFAATGAPALGLLYREGRIGTAAAVDAIAMTASSLAAILGAVNGLGVWSLVLLALVNEAMICAGVWWACPWKPTRDIGQVSWRSLVGFGAHLTGFNVINYCSRNVDQPAVGWASGTTALGLYGRAVQLTVLPVQFGIAPFTTWIIASLARLRDQPPAYAALFRQKLNNLLHVSMPVAFACLIVPELGVGLLFGPRWLETAPMVRWLGVALAVQPWLFAPCWLLESVGRVQRLFVIALLGFAVAAAACFFAAAHGPLVVAEAMAAATLIQVLLGVTLCEGQTPARFADWWRPALRPIALHGGFGLLMLAVKLGAPPELRPWVCATLIIGLGVVYYVSLWFASSLVRDELRGHFLWPK